MKWHRFGLVRGCARRTPLACRPRLEVEVLEDRLTPAVTLPSGFGVVPVATGLSNPTAMEIAPDGRIFVAQQGGALRVIDANGNLLSQPFVTLTVDSTGERGLIGVTLDPNFESNHFVYVYWTVPGTGEHNRISRFIDQNNVAMPGSETDIFDLDPLSSATNHNGGSLHFGIDGKLYVGVGENANGSNSQTLSTDLGKLLRINSDGTIPTDNPFYSMTTGNNRAIWALGLRNPFTFGVQPGTGRIFIDDVGENTWEEIDDGIASSNYGWPFSEGFKKTGDQNTTIGTYRDPLLAYSHADGSQAITGGTFYNPSVTQFPSNYVGEYFYSDLGGGYIKVFNPSNSSVTGFATGLSVPVDLDVGSGGSLYYLVRGTGSNTGGVFRVTFNGAANAKYVTHLYEDLFGREPDAGGQDFWTGQLNSGVSRSDVASAFLGTMEYRDHLVNTIYQKYLHRGADSSGLMFYEQYLASGGTPDGVSALLGSQEYFALHGSTNSNFVTALYSDVLNRAPDSGGQMFYMQQLASGTSRVTVAQEMLGSSEAKQVLVQSFYQLYLKRSADPGGLAMYSDQLQNGVPESTVILMIVASDEYYARP